MLLNEIQRCFRKGEVLYTRHARDEMRTEELGRVREEEVFEAIMSGGIIEEYRGDKPYPSLLIYGRTQNGRPLHIVCAYSGEDDLVIVITAYQPDPNLWIDFKRRRGK